MTLTRQTWYPRIHKQFHENLQTTTAKHSYLHSYTIATYLIKKRLTVGCRWSRGTVAGWAIARQLSLITCNFVARKSSVELSCRGIVRGTHKRFPSRQHEEKRPDRAEKTIRPSEFPIKPITRPYIIRGGPRGGLIALWRVAFFGAAVRWTGLPPMESS